MSKIKFINLIKFPFILVKMEKYLINELGN
jgi:hypothetical protein